MKRHADAQRRYLVASDFDQTLSFKDSGVILSELLGTSAFAEKVCGLAEIHLVQQGGELAYLLLHDPEYRRVRREHLVEVGKRIRLKANIGRLVELLREGVGGIEADLMVVSAAPEEVIGSALEGLVPPEHIFGTRFRYSSETGEIEAAERVPAGHGKVAVLEQVRSRFGIAQDRVVYVGDGSSDVHVMLHVNHHGGLTVAVSPSKNVAHIARRTVLSDDTLSLLVPVLEEVARLDAEQIRALFRERGLLIQEWDRGRTDWLTIRAGEADWGDGDGRGARDRPERASVSRFPTAPETPVTDDEAAA